MIRQLPSKRFASGHLVAVVLCVLAACGGDDDDTADAAVDAQAVDGATSMADAAVGADSATASFVVTSTAFANGESIPPAHTCDGMDLSPQLAWSGAPAETQSYAFILVDISLTPNFLHSVAWDIPVSRSELPEDVPNEYQPYGADDLKQALSWLGGQTYGYAGPCPPSKHTYQYIVHALDTASLADLSANTTRSAARTAIEAASLGSATLEGTYQH